MVMSEPQEKTTKCAEGNNRPQRCKMFAFTFFPENDNVPNLEIKNASYVIMGKEICPNTTKLHYQSFVYFDKPIEFTACSKRLMKHFNKGCHVSVCNGSIEDNIKYCSKDGEVLTYGKVPKGQGARKDLDDVKNDLVDGKTSVDKILLEDPLFYHQYGRTLNAIEDVCLRKVFRTVMTTCNWFYGPTGVGKSHKVFENYNTVTHYIYPNDNGWWDGYKGQETVIINEFRGEIQYKELLDLIDKWPKTVRRRGREPVPFLAKHIDITSCMKPNEVYHNLAEKDSLSQLLRRIKLIKLCKGFEIDESSDAKSSCSDPFSEV